MTFNFFSAFSIFLIWSTDWKCRKMRTFPIYLMAFQLFFFVSFPHCFLLWTLTVNLYKYENIYENLSTIRDYIVFYYVLLQIPLVGGSLTQAL